MGCHPLVLSWVYHARMLPPPVPEWPAQCWLALLLTAHGYCLEGCMSCAQAAMTHPQLLLTQNAMQDWRCSGFDVPGHRHTWSAYRVLHAC